ncbi:Speckle-type POZ protein B [Orchesella cincta]|uniref:Speckle-type POZ protein B n=1 Tax=Orchesella cincta TaxID=48709 RepID=A0A1D2MAL8_ORCCI|nr:Speckle-type POZ protein B [Orchesella cincta]
MEKFLLKDHPINLKFSVMNHNNGGNYRRGNAASAGAAEFFKPRHGQEYAKTKLPLLNFKRFQNFFQQQRLRWTKVVLKKFSSTFCVQWWIIIGYSRMIPLNKIRIYGSPLDQLLALNKDLKLKFNVVFDQNFVANEMVACYDDYGKCYFENVIRSEHYFVSLSGYNGIFGHVSIELVGLDIPMGSLPDDLRSANKKLLEEQRFTDFALVAENGQKLPCLRAFLATASPVFDRMLQSECKETKEGACKLDISAEGVKANYLILLLDVPSETPSVALELLKSGEKYDIFGLEAAMKTIFLSNQSNG